MSTLSVIVPAYNVADLLLRAIASLQAQSRPVHQIVIVDDASTDGTAEVMRRLATEDDRILPLFLAENGGPSAARNAGADACTGDWIGILDGDDAWRPERAATLIAEADAVDADLILDNLVLHDLAAGRDIRRMIAPDWRTHALTQEFYWANCVFGNAQFSIMKPVWRRAMQRRAGVRYDEGLRMGEDLLFIADLLAGGARGIVTAEPLYIYSTRVGAESGARNTRSSTVMKFALLAERVEGFVRTHAGALDAATLRAIRRCQASYRAAERLERLRPASPAGRPAALFRLLTRPDVLRLLLRLRYRKRAVRSGRYALDPVTAAT